MAWIFSICKYSARLLTRIPPVGIKLICGNGSEFALMAFNPPIASAGKNFRIFSPILIARIISVGVTAPTRMGIGFSCAQTMTSSTIPGETRYCAPESRAGSACSRLITVPAPTMPFCTSRAMTRIDPRAASVRSVTSATGRPPASNASAIGLACCAESISRTGMTPIS
jgi:hypothetical protein